jgi:acyl-CoA thioester hydrolase
MKQTEGANGQRMTEYAPQPTIGRVLDRPEPVSVGQESVPATDRPTPRVEGVLRARLSHERLTAPAIVIAANPQDRNTRIVQIREGGKHAESGARHGITPRKPEIEQIAHDHERAIPSGNVAKQPQQGAFSVLGCDAKVGVADDLTRGGEHTGSLTFRTHRHKPPADGAWRAPQHTASSPFLPLSVASLPALPAMPFESTSDLRVRYAETDQMGVVYHANYLVWCEVGRTDFIRALGKSYADLEREGVMLAVSDVTMRLHASARYDDPIRVCTRLSAVGSRSIEFSYRVIRADTDALLVSATTTLVALNSAGRVAALPKDLRRTLDGSIVPDANAR